MNTLSMIILDKRIVWWDVVIEYRVATVGNEPAEASGCLLEFRLLDN